MSLPYIHMIHVPELQKPELLLALVCQPRILLIAPNSQTCRIGNHYPPLHDRVLHGEKEENQ
jgi:hypothetical protein